MKTPTMTVEEAARALGMRPQGVRIQMQRGLLDIGLCLPASTGKGYRYYIYPAKVEKITGRKVCE